jgi:hypothetical protein
VLELQGNVPETPIYSDHLVFYYKENLLYIGGVTSPASFKFAGQFQALEASP